MQKLGKPKNTRISHFMGKPKNTAKTDSRFRFSSMGNGFHNPFHLSFQKKNRNGFCKKKIKIKRGNGSHNPFCKKKFKT